MQELEQEARPKAREARVAFASQAAGDNTPQGPPPAPAPSEDELMEAFEQAKAALGRIRVRHPVAWVAAPAFAEDCRKRL